ncbi:MAG: septal ring lytic transglycosylase RlpA family protein [bacterium]
MRRLLAVVLVLTAVLSGCGRRRHTRSVPPAPVLKVGAEEEGIASWYGHPYHGRRAANGEIYDMEKMTAAHRTLPFETWVEVRNLTNNRAVEVRITDRGPFVEGRIIDLSRAAARKIQMIGPGTAPVRVRILKLPGDEPAGVFAVQVGAFAQRANAERKAREIERGYGPVSIVRRDGDPPLWRVLVGRESSLEAANKLAARIAARSGPAFVVRLPPSSDN